jgi:HSP20 family protein
MSLIRWSPMMDAFGDMDDMFNRMPALINSQGVRAFVPSINMYETDTAVVVETPLAGVDPKDVEVSVEKGVLTLKGESKREHEVEEKSFYRKEVRSGSFYREIVLPSRVDEDNVTAEFENGLLKITAPKVQATPSKKISVKIIKKDNGKK